MEDVVDLKEEILKKSLAEVKQNEGGDEPCVICLEPISEQATCIPCQHHNFDYLCLLSWLEERNTCPLCKATATKVGYTDSAGKPSIYLVPDQPKSVSTRGSGSSYRGRPAFANGLPRPPRRPRRYGAPPSPTLIQRRDVYRNQLYSLHVGSNRVSAYQDLTPPRIANSPALISRAKAWVRRELEVFTFLSENEPVQEPSAEPNLRNVSNAFFLLEYIIATVKTVDIKGSSGQAQDMLADFLGRENARLFLHELSSFLRSPYETVEAWDRHVQYPNPEREIESSGTIGGKRKRPAPALGNSHNVPARITRLEHRQSRQCAPKRRLLDRYVPD